ncbi:MAG: hypothetical protein CMK63_11580 [Pseudoalteromonadaceae bacterium]|nr:hypothetical protein [Pseudoalteromonadaceae bacterium]
MLNVFIIDKFLILAVIREQYLRVGRADWLSWSSAVGTRGMSKNNRNHMLKYFSNVSQMNFLIASAVRVI